MLFRNISIIGTALALCACSDDATTKSVAIKGAGGLSAITLGASDPASLKVKVYEMWVSESPLCTDAVKVFPADADDTNADAPYVNFLGTAVDIGTADVATGEYPCVAFVMSDNLLVTPSVTEGSCTADVEFTLDVCKNNGDGAPVSTLPDGTTKTCTAGDDRIAMYLSTASTATTGGEENNAFAPPTTEGDATKGFKIAQAFTVEADMNAIFSVDGSGKIDGTGMDCEFHPPLFSFSASAQ